MELPAQALEALRQRFLDRSAEDLQRLRGHLSGEPLAAADLRLLVHRLAGAAGTFGYPQAGEAAGKVDDLMVEGRFDREDLRPLIAAMEALPVTTHKPRDVP